MPWRQLRITLVLAIIVIWGCSSGGDPYGSNGGGGTRVFQSGNLGNGASFVHTFTAPGTFPYYCRHHGGPGGTGMSGVITVTDPPNATPVEFAYSITGSILPDFDIKTGDRVRWTNNSGLTHTVESDN